jgi:putative flippase GtrA
LTNKKLIPDERGNREFPGLTGNPGKPDAFGYINSMLRSILIPEFGKYFLVCILCFGLDFSLLVALREYAGMHYLVAGLISILAGNILNYTLSTKWVFHSRKLEDKSKELTVFLTIGLGAIPFHHLVFWLCTDFGDLHYQISKLIAVGTTFILIFILRKVMLF